MCPCFYLLSQLDLSRNGLGSEGAKSLAEALKVNASLTSINLKQNKLGDEGWGVILAGACANKNSKIASIDVSRENIGPSGAKLIGEALRTSASASLTQVLAFCSFSHRTFCFISCIQLQCPCFYSAAARFILESSRS